MTRSIRLDGPVLIEVAYSPSSEGARAGLFFLVIVGWAGLMRFHLCRPSESNEGRRTIRFIKGDGPFVRRGA